jgi:hypothetical protein
MKTYLKSAMNLTSNPTLLVTTCIGGSIMSVQLGELPAILKRDSLTGYRPMGTTVEGVKNGIFPVLTPKTLAASLALKVKGHDVPLGDGLSCVSQKMASDLARELKKLGIMLDELEFEWMAGVPQGANASQLDAAKPSAPTSSGQPTIEEQLADSPF